MFFVEFLFAFFIALLFMGIGFGLLRDTHYYSGRRWRDFLSLFFLFMLVIWTAGLWLTPVGPVAYDVYWAPYTFGGVFLLLLLAAIALPGTGNKHQRGFQEPELREVAKQEREEREAAEVVAPLFGFFFWILVVVLIVAIVAGYADTAV